VSTASWPDEGSEISAFRAVLEEAFRREWPIVAARAHRYGGAAAADVSAHGIWTALAAMGVFGVPFDDEVGGSDAGLTELAVAFECAGRFLAPLVITHTIAAALIVDAAAESAARGRWLRRLAAGERRGTLASRCDVTATPGTTRWLLDGSATAVVAAQDADVLCVQADNGLFMVSLAAPGVEVRPLSTMAGPDICRVALANVEVVREDVLSTCPSAAALESALAAVTLLQSCELLGAAREVIRQTVAYTSARVQFGRPIASFQAAQHLLADATIGIDGAALAVDHALQLVDLGLPAMREIGIAALAAGQAAKISTFTAHQLHGGIGYAIESDLHLWSERVKVLDLLRGDRDLHVRWISRTLFTGRSQTFSAGATSSPQS
jgi:alkylation response protein AidB-like acyl-CoA dehydrogenase